MGTKATRIGAPARRIPMAKRQPIRTVREPVIAVCRRCHHRTSGSATISRFDYTYDAVGNILTWQQQADAAAPVRWTYGYDAADQLIDAVKRTTDAQPTVLARYGYQYDAAGNRTAEQIDDALVGATVDARNRLVSQQPTGALRIAGQLDEAASVSVNGKVASVDASNRFTATAPISAGANAFTVVAKDPAGNERTQIYDFTSSGTSRSFTYDANGNLTSDGTRTFEWDAVNRLVAVNNGTKRSEFTYDGLDRRVRILEKESGATVRDANLFWGGTEIIEERLATGEVNRFFDDGETHNGVARYLTRDHLGSVREVTDSSGAVLTRNDYDPYGRVTRIAGTADSRFGYTGHMNHVTSGLTLALYRAYDPALGRWLSEDPVGLAGGVNVHGYVRGNSINLLDPLGLWDFKPGTPRNTLQPAMTRIEGRVDRAFREVAGRDGFVTATTNGQHKRGSKHYEGNAVDLRGRDLTDAQGRRVRDLLKESLGPDYDVLWETYRDRNNNHIHIEYDPDIKPGPRGNSLTFDLRDPPSRPNNLPADRNVPPACNL